MSIRITSSSIFYGPSIVTNGLVLYLDAANDKSYPRSGTAWNDLTPNGFVGTLTNGATFGSDNCGNITFDGSNDYVSGSSSLITLSTVGGLFASASLTWSVSSWFRPNSITANNGAIVSRAGGIGTGGTFTTYVSASVLNTRLRGGNIRTITSTLTVGWHELAVTWDGTTARAYYDGSFVNTVAVGTAARQTVMFNLGNNSDFGEPFAGRIAETKVYDRALSATEILRNYNAKRNRFGV